MREDESDDPSGTNPDRIAGVQSDGEQTLADGPLMVKLTLSAEGYTRLPTALKLRAESFEANDRDNLADEMQAMTEQARMQVMDQQDRPEVTSGHGKCDGH